MAARTRGEDVEDQPGAVENLDAEHAFKIALLRGPQGLVEDHALRAVLEHRQTNFLGLAGADKESRVW